MVKQSPAERIIAVLKEDRFFVKKGKYYSSAKRLRVVVVFLQSKTSEFL